MSSPTPERFVLKAEQARKRAVRSLFLTRGAAVVAVAAIIGFVGQSVFFKPTSERPAEPKAELAPHIVGGLSSFSGIDQNAKPFSVKAMDGVQDTQNETLMHLKTVTGSFVRKLGGEVIVTSDQADYEIKNKDLKVSGNVRFEEPGRYVAKLATAEVNLDRQRISTHDPVQVETAGATVSADSMETSEDGTVVVLRGHVRAHFATDGVQ